MSEEENRRQLAVWKKRLKKYQETDDSTLTDFFKGGDITLILDALEKSYDEADDLFSDLVTVDYKLSEALIKLKRNKKRKSTK